MRRNSEAQFFRDAAAHLSSRRRSRYDSHGAADHRIDLTEFGWFLGDVALDAGGDAATAREVLPEVVRRFHPDARKFDPIVVGHRDAIKVVFDKLDKNKNGYLEKEELKDIVAKYQGEAFDADKFFGWYDTHGPADHRIDVTEFGWYLADCALELGGAEKAELVMAEVVQKFDPDAA